MTTALRYTVFRGSADTSQLRVAKYEGEDHFVIPVVMMVGNHVVRPMHSKGTEFVPLSEISRVPAGWNGRAVVPDHPKNGLGSANDPVTLETFSIGALFDSRIEDGRLVADAYLSPERCQRSDLGKELLARVEAKETIEVSVGAWVRLEEKHGVNDAGLEYDYVWHDPVPDHLAMLPAGTRGACSVEAGCGGLRVNKEGEDAMSDVTTDEEIGVGKVADKDGIIDGGKGIVTCGSAIISRIEIALTALAKKTTGLTVNELRQGIWEALYSAEPAFLGIDDIFIDNNVVVYSVNPDGKYTMYRRGFTVDDKGKCVLSGDREQVQMEIEYQPVAAAEESGVPAPAVLRAACKCQGDHAAHPDNKENKMADLSEKVKELAGRLVASAKAPFEEKDRAGLEVLSETTLAALVHQYEKPAEDKPVELTEDQWMAKAPATLRSMLDGFVASQTQRKNDLIALLKDGQEVYSEDELKSKDLAELTKIASLLGVDKPAPVDFSGVATPRAAARSEREVLPAPKGYTLALAANKDEREKTLKGLSGKSN